MIKQVVHCKKDPHDVYIGRGSKWGNPFKIGPHGDRDAVIALYAEWINSPEQAGLRRAARLELRGKILGCFCAPKSCHGDILYTIANRKRICVCGGREFNDREWVYRHLDKMLTHFESKRDLIIVQGEARGADTLGKEWAISRGIEHDPFPIEKWEWTKHGNYAGHLRNKRMLDSGLDGCIAFPGNKGTENMIKICREAHVPVMKMTGIKAEYR